MDTTVFAEIGDEYLSDFTFDMHEDTPSADHAIDIMNCIRFGDISPLKSLLLADRNVVNADINGWGKPHMYASKAGRLSIVKVLVENGADVNASKTSGETALYFAIWYDHFDVFEYLVSKGANVNQRDSSNSTPLMQAALYKRKEMFVLLIKQGAEINAEDDRGYSAVEHLRNMYFALYKDSYGRSADQLRSDGISKISVLDLLGPGDNTLNPRECNKLGIIDVKDLIHHDDIKSLSLLVGIPDIDVINMDIAPFGKPLIYAAMRGNLAIVKLLVQNGADVNVTDECGSSALYYAVWSDHYDVAFYLVSRGANVNQNDKHNSTPLIEAAYYNRKEMVELFIKRDGDICAKNNHGINAIDFAKREGYREIATLLEKEVRKRGLDNTGIYGDISVDEAQEQWDLEHRKLFGTSGKRKARQDEEEDESSDYEYTGFSGTDGSAFDMGIPGSTKEDRDEFYAQFSSSDSEDDEEYGIHRGPREERKRKRKR